MKTSPLVPLLLCLAITFSTQLVSALPHEPIVSGGAIQESVNHAAEGSKGAQAAEVAGHSKRSVSSRSVKAAGAPHPPAKTAASPGMFKTLQEHRWTQKGLAFMKHPATIAANVLGLAALAVGSWTLDRQKENIMNFISPNQSSNYTCGTSATINVNTVGFGSVVGLTTAKFSLLDSEGNKIGDIMDKKLIDFLQVDRTLGIGRPRHGSGFHVWTVPEVPTGAYQLLFESVNALKAKYSKQRFNSPIFHIECPSYKPLVNGNDTSANAPIPAEAAELSPGLSPESSAAIADLMKNSTSPKTP